MNANQVIVSPKGGARADLLALLEAHGYRVAEVDDLEQARESLDAGGVDVVLLDPVVREPESVRCSDCDVALAEREAQLTLCIEHAPVPIAMFDDQMRYLAVSRCWSSAYRLEDEELVGRSHYEVFPELPQRWRDIHARALAGEVLRHDCDSFVRPDGRVDWVRWEIRPWWRHDARGAARVGGIILFSEVITEQHETEAALRESESRLRHLADAVPDLIWELLPDGTMTYANHALREYFGVDSLGLADWAGIIHPDDFSTAAEILARAFAVGGSGPLPTMRLRRHDGVYRWFANHGTVVYGDAGERRYVVGTSTDIHELTQTRDALTESKRRLITALRAAGMGSWRWDVDANLVTVHPSLAELLGRDPSEFEGADMVTAMGKVIHPDDFEATERAFHELFDQGVGAEISIDWRIIRPSGEVLWLQTKGRLELDPTDGHRVLAGVSVDITRRKLLEAQLQQAQKMEAIGLLAGGVAHDFNNILTVVLGHATLLEADARLAPELVGSIHEIVVAAEQAAELTNQLLAFGRRQVLQRRDLDLNQVVGELVDLVRRLLGGRIACIFVPASGTVPVRADRGMLTQVVLNLVVNARDAMAGEGRLTIVTRIGPDPGHAGEWALVEVSDTGSGIPPEVLPHVFEPFYTTKGLGQGTGLGLATVYGIVEQHRGFIDVDSYPGRGTRFTVGLPLRTS